MLRLQPDTLPLISRRSLPFQGRGLGADPSGSTKRIMMKDFIPCERDLTIGSPDPLFKIGDRVRVGSYHNLIVTDVFWTVLLPKTLGKEKITYDRPGEWTYSLNLGGSVTDIYRAMPEYRMRKYSPLGRFVRRFMDDVCIIMFGRSLSKWQL